MEGLLVIGTDCEISSLIANSSKEIKDVKVEENVEVTFLPSC